MSKINNLDTALLKLVQDNITKIKVATLKNPSIKKDDEWRDENHWDKLYKELSTK